LQIKDQSVAAFLMPDFVDLKIERPGRDWADSSIR